MAKAKSNKKATQDHESRVNAITERFKEALQPGERMDLQEFIDSFQNDVIGDLVAQWGGWNSSHMFSQVRAILSLMIQAWQAGRDKLREEIQEL